MRHLILAFPGLFLKRIVTIASAVALICVPGVLAQRGGAHVGGAGRVGGAGQFPSGGRVATPRAPAAPRPITVPPTPVAPWHPATISPPARPVFPPRPITVTPAPGPVAPRALPMPGAPWRPLPGFRTPGPHPQLIPPKRLPLPRPTVIRPVAPIFSYPAVFGGPPFFFGLGAGFNALWWQGCGPFSLWYLGCNTAPFYGYGFGNYLSGSSELYEPPPLPAYQPLYLYSGQPRELVELYLKDGTVYDVTDYWVVNDELHFTTTEGDKSDEHTIPFDDLDLQKTIDVNTQRGFHFTLRNEPIEQYLQDHPEIGSSPSSTIAPPGTLQSESPASPQTAPSPPQAQSPSPAPEAPQP